MIDYCHNVDGMRQLADFVERMVSEPLPGGARDRRHEKGAIPTEDRRHRTGRAIGVIGIPGDRRDDDQRAYGAVAATAFDEIIVREDRNLRGRTPGETAGHVVDGVKAARADGTARTTRADKILDEMTAVRTALRRAAAGDLIVMCVDDAVGCLPRGAGLGPDPGRADRLHRPRRARRTGGLDLLADQRRVRSWSLGTSSVSSAATSTGRAPTPSRSSRTAGRSSWHSRTTTRARRVRSRRPDRSRR